MQELPNLADAALTAATCSNTIINAARSWASPATVRSDCRAVLWRGKTLMDLNTLIPAD